jgi:hypothetical protein
MKAFSGRVVGPSEELQLWAQVGAAVGKCQYDLNADSILDVDFVPPEADAIPQLMRKLGASGRALLLGTINSTVRGLKAPPAKRSIRAIVDRTEGRYLAMCELDERLRAALQNLPPPETLLTLDKRSLTFFGEKRPLSDYPQAEMACLWVLAENAGNAVSRKRIIEQGKIQTDSYNLKWTVHRLRRILRDLATVACSRRGVAQPPGMKDGFIPRGGAQPLPGSRVVHTGPAPWPSPNPQQKT